MNHQKNFILTLLLCIGAIFVSNANDCWFDYYGDILNNNPDPGTPKYDLIKAIENQEIGLMACRI